MIFVYKRAEMCISIFIQPTAWHNNHLSLKSKEGQEKTPLMDAKAEAAAPQPSYREFEPYCEWDRKTDKDILVVQLPPEFKKDHLKAMVSNQGLLRFSGECPIDEKTRKRFAKEIRVAKDCNMNGIQAKFLRGTLQIIMPKNINHTAARDQAAPPPVGKSQEQAQGKPTEEKGEDDGKGKVDESRTAEEERKGVEGSVSMLKMGKKMAVSGFLVVALVVAFGAYAAYNYQSFINFSEK